MMIGEMLCLGAYFFMKYVVHKEDPGGYDSTSKLVSPMIMLPVTQRYAWIRLYLNEYII